MFRKIFSLRRKSTIYRSIADALGLSIRRARFRMRRFARSLLSSRDRGKCIGRRRLYGLMTVKQDNKKNISWHTREVTQEGIAFGGLENSLYYGGYEVPLNYAENKLTVLPKDPHSIFAYWEFTEDARLIASLHYQRSWEDLRLTARIYDITGINHFIGSNAPWKEYFLHPLANNYYFANLVPNHSYCVELGVKSSEDDFLPLLRSNYTNTPRDYAGPPRHRHLSQVEQGKYLQQLRQSEDSTPSSHSVYS